MAFPMWTDFARLGNALAELLHDWLGPHGARCDLAITMTGEMADCFDSRAQGVASILDAIGQKLSAECCHVYSVGGKWFTVEQAKKSPWKVASSNWDALVRWLITRQDWKVAQYDLVLDIGSTTIDILPLRSGNLLTSATTDRQRLQLGQLVYSGMERTPIFAIVNEVTVDGVACPVMAERFATMLDVHVILGNLAEQQENLDTADGKPRTRQHALARLARMVGEDLETLEVQQIEEIAEQILAAQVRQVAAAVIRNLTLTKSPNQTTAQGITASLPELPPVPPCYRIFVTGHGQPLVARLQRLPELENATFTYLSDLLEPEAARCAPALAVAQLWQSETHRVKRSNASLNLSSVRWPP